MGMMRESAVCVCVCGKKVGHDCLEAYVCFAVELFFGLV